MFIGHFGLGFAAKRVAPQVSLGTAFLAAQWLDLLWPTLLLLGMESVRIAPGATAVTPLVFDHYPLSHSLLAVACWGLALGALYALARGQVRGAVVVGLLVVSHWLLDAIVHVPDLPLAPGLDTMVGLGLWQSRAATLAVEIPIFAVGVWLYATSTEPIGKTGRYGLAGLVAFLAVIYAGNLFGGPASQRDRHRLGGPGAVAAGGVGLLAGHAAHGPQRAYGRAGGAPMTEVDAVTGGKGRPTRSGQRTGYGWADVPLATTARSRVRRRGTPLDRRGARPQDARDRPVVAAEPVRRPPPRECALGQSQGVGARDPARARGIGAARAGVDSHKTGGRAGAGGRRG